MKGKTHSTEEIIRILRQADGGETAQAICREHNISEQTFYRLSCSFSFLRSSRKISLSNVINALLLLVTLYDAIFSLSRSSMS